MSKLKFLIKNLRIFSFLLFFIPLFALLGSLFLNNHLVNYKVSYFYPFGKTDSGIFECTYENAYCANILKKIEFHNCSKHVVKARYIINGTPLSQILKELGLSGDGTVLTPYIIDLIKKTKYSEFKNIKYLVSSPNYKQIDSHCIKNSILYPIYKNFSFAGKLFYKLRKNSSFGVSHSISPFFYGETSISNIVKRFPFSYFFKPLLFISSFIMILYWLNYKKIFFLLGETKKINKFVIFGISSSIFLFLHVLFLGTEIDNSIVKVFRRFIIIFFILSELLAQLFLARRIYILRNILFNYTYKALIYLKLTFVAIILLITIVTVSILIFFNPGQIFNNILEWNYFCFLLIFYMLSAMMWRTDQKK